MSESPLTLGEVLRRSTEHLAAKGVDSPRVDAEHLLGHALGLARIELYLHLDRPLGAEELTTARELVGRRAAREPLQYVLGEWGFRRLTLAVDGRALIPRPETEAVVERCLELLAGRDAPTVLDVGVGSGAIALAIADEHPDAVVTGIDVSDAALALARENAARTGIAIALHHHDLFTGLPAGPWALVVSNPPYVDEGERSGLAPEIAGFEPETALFATGHLEMVARASFEVLARGGALVLECHSERAGETAALLSGLGFRDVRVTSDDTGRERAVEGVR